MALYHKHRPQQFTDLVGQEHIIQTITNQIKSGKVAHAYLFSGPRGVGKTTMARLLSKSLNCEKRENNQFEPCDQCSSCQEIKNSRSIDVIEIDAASHTGVDNVRENIIENAQFKPTKSKYKIFIVDEVHMLSNSAFNALLKTLEEPPTHVIFILATTELHKLPATIISRCQRYEFKKMPHDNLKKHLNKIANSEGIKIDDNVLENVINKSEGCARDAISLLDQLFSLGEKHLTSEKASIFLPPSYGSETINFLKLLADKNSSEALEAIKKLTEHGVNFSQFFSEFISLLRLVLVSALTNDYGNLEDKTKKELDSIREKIGNKIIYLIDLTIKRQANLALSTLPQLPLELLILEWCSDANEPNYPPTEFKENNKPTYPPVVFSADKTDLKKNDTNKEELLEKMEKINLNKSKIDEIEIPKKEVSKNTEPVSLDQIKKAWFECVKTLEVESPSLSFIVKSAELLNASDEDINIQVPFSFHKDALMSANHYSKIVKCLTNFLNKNVRLNISVAESKNNLDDLASALGGEVVA